MLSGLDVALRMITAPNSAFVHIRDNSGQYFAWSIGIFVLGSISLSVSFALLDQTLGYWEDMVLYMGIDLLVGIVFAVVIYLVGRQLGGNGMWRTVFSAIFYTNVLVFPFALFVAVTLLAAGVSTWPFLVDADTWDSESIDDMLDLLGYLAVLIVGSIAFAVWIVIVLIKAVKTVNGFGTTKAFGLIVLALLVSYVVVIPFGM